MEKISMIPVFWSLTTVAIITIIGIGVIMYRCLEENDKTFFVLLALLVPCIVVVWLEVLNATYGVL